VFTIKPVSQFKKKDCLCKSASSSQIEDVVVFLEFRMNLFRREVQAELSNICRVKFDFNKNIVQSKHNMFNSFIQYSV
jgi:hypothetical protein